MIKFDRKQYININNKSSEWIGIDLPARIHLFIDYGNFMYPLLYKRINTKSGISWRSSYLKGSWMNISDVYLINKLENIYKNYLHKLRNNKLKRILDGNKG